MNCPRLCRWLPPLALGLFLLASLVFAPGALAGATGGTSASEAFAPDPSLTPGEVVSIQLEALRNNDAVDSGIAIAFRFASPANRRTTGPLPRFAQMIKNGPYALMLRYKAVAYDETDIQRDAASLRVTLVGDQQTLSYVFYLSRQQGGECPSCWMTDAVTVEPFIGKQA